MTLAYVMLNSELSASSQVKGILKQLDDVKEVYSINGSYDFIIKLETNDLREIRDVIHNNIERIPYVKSHVTLRVIE